MSWSDHVIGPRATKFRATRECCGELQLTQAAERCRFRDALASGLGRYMHRQFQRQGQPPRTWTSLCKPSRWTVRRTPRRISTWIMTSKMAQAQMIRAPSPAISDFRCSDSRPWRTPGPLCTIWKRHSAFLPPGVVSPRCQRALRFRTRHKRMKHAEWTSRNHLRKSGRQIFSGVRI